MAAVLFIRNRRNVVVSQHYLASLRRDVAVPMILLIHFRRYFFARSHTVAVVETRGEAEADADDEEDDDADEQRALG